VHNSVNYLIFDKEVKMSPFLFVVVIRI